MPVSQLRDHLSELVDSVRLAHDRITLTRHGEPVAVLIAADDLDSILETLDILSEPGALEPIRQAEAELAAGKGISLTEIRAEFRTRPEVARG